MHRTLPLDWPAGTRARSGSRPSTTVPRASAAGRWCRRVRRLAFATILLAHVLAGAAWGAESKAIERARAAGEKAQGLARAARFDEAVTLLRGALAALPAEADAREARAALNFNLGWTLTQMARRTDTGADETRAAAEAAYRRVLEDFPANAQAAVNLALLLEAAQPDAALRALEAAERAGATNSPLVTLARADLLVRRGDAARAWGILWALARKDMGNAAIHERLVRLYPLLPGDRHRRLFDYCLELDALGFRPLAGTGMGELAQLSWRTNTALAEEALFHWAAQQVRQGRLTPDLLARFPAPAEWPSPALRGLHDLAAGQADSTGWWTGTPPRAHVASGVLRVAGDQAAQEGNEADAIALYQRAMKTGPDVRAYSEESLRGLTAAKLEAAIPLACLLHRRGQQSPAEVQQLSSLLDELWNGKTALYQEWNVPGMLQYHRTLGIIQTEQTNYPAAEYHLKRLLAIEESVARREQRPPAAQPEVHALLARGYEQRGQVDVATEHLVAAARGYWAANDPAATRQSLEAIKPEWNVAAAQRAEVQRLTATVNTVERFKTLPAATQATEFVRFAERPKEELVPGVPVDDRWRAQVLGQFLELGAAPALERYTPATAEKWQKAFGTVQKRLDSGKLVLDPPVQQRLRELDKAAKLPPPSR